MPPLSRRPVGLLLIVLVLLTGGAAGAVAGGWWGWRSPASLPPEAVLVQVVGPGSTVTGRVDGVFGWDPPLAGWRDRVAVRAFGDDGYEAGEVELTRRAGDAPGALREAYAGLAAAGWRTHPVTTDEYGRRFWALRGGVTAEVEIDNVTGDDGVQADRFTPSVRYTFRRAVPGAVRWAMPLGWLTGVLVAVFLLVPAVRLARRSDRPRLVRILAGIGFGALAPATLLTTLGVVAAGLPALDPEPEIPDAPWFAFTMAGVRPLALAGAVLVVAALGLAVARPSRPAPAARSSP